MKFINPGDAVQVRIQEGPNRFRWELVKNGDIINLARDVGVNYGFEEVKVEATTGNIGDVEVETKQIDTDKNTDHSEKQNEERSYSKKLNNINGIGKKTAEDIIKVFPTERKLVEVIAVGGSLPFRDDIEILLKKQFLKKEESL